MSPFGWKKVHWWRIAVLDGSDHARHQAVLLAFSAERTRQLHEVICTSWKAILCRERIPG